ncbi:MAG: DUF565 domain-containing protein [Cyanobacteria bacterium]|uniref:DUF565 domain-containing protein n=1 Tax=Geminocystis sp. TaxID=2664100 RepID=UPI001D8DF06C|nr:DUF565 domain-containing protein [Cyanobacteria bacterium CG_2015-16_32_12]NCO77167.1 DUF565 domain-containing protein [Cyanobacteria bacterium CG_2015-22_32_23]NCQ04376.1 DUF565 domain-containing protein [Cyanobacteria bacterium CG_2015-09_32_10]NCQ41014.1 DUF565 domain-containing protein [Cyanobacteria bacterium CG_2015-04_32_10]
MQETRLNSLLSKFFSQFNNFFTNPWRKSSLTIICLLGGFFLASAFSTSAGQVGLLDMTMAVVFLLSTEIISFFVYRRRNSNNKSLWVDLLNSTKIGFTYGLYLEALKLNS